MSAVTVSPVPSTKSTRKSGNMQEPAQDRVGNLRCELVHITPELAASWRNKYNVRNFRPYSEDTAKVYADDMRHGRFGVAESAIVLCKDPNTGEVFLGNGQHRLGGCELAGKPFWSIVLYGQDPMAVVRMDTGKKRKLADYLHFLGHPNPLILSATLRILYTYKADKSRLSSRKFLGTADELLDLLQNREDIHRCVRFAAVNGGYGDKPIPMTPSWLAVARLLIAEVEDPHNEIDWFFASLANQDTSNELGNPDHPVCQMRRLLLQRGTNAKKEMKLPPPTLLATLLKCWNNTRDEDYTKLGIRLTGPTAEPWPIPHA